MVLASKNKYLLHLYDSFSGEGYDIQEFPTKEEAIKQAQLHTHGRDMTLMYVIDDKGNVVYKTGKY